MVGVGSVIGCGCAGAGVMKTWGWRSRLGRAGMLDVVDMPNTCMHIRRQAPFLAMSVPRPRLRLLTIRSSLRACAVSR
jgi:hypothetical protein